MKTTKASKVFYCHGKITVPVFQRVRRKVIIHGSPSETSRPVHPHKVPSTVSYIVPTQYSSKTVITDNANNKFSGIKSCLPRSLQNFTIFRIRISPLSAFVFKYSQCGGDWFSALSPSICCLVLKKKAHYWILRAVFNTSLHWLLVYFRNLLTIITNLAYFHHHCWIGSTHSFFLLLPLSILHEPPFIARSGHG